MSTQCIYSLSDFFSQVSTRKCWTAWRTEERKNKTTGEVKFTKVPYRTVASESRSNDPTTWISIDDAEAVASTEGFINSGIGGVGLWLGIEYGTEYRLGGVDLDTCLMPSGLVPWAKEIIGRFNTYGEISPSKTGMKLYFLYRVADVAAIRLITGTDWSKNFKERTGSDHAPGFELHIGHRYFAMTGDLYDGCPEALRVIEVNDIRWLIEDAALRFITKPTYINCADAAQPDGEWTGEASRAVDRNHADNSRSARAMRKLKKLYHEGSVDTEAEGKARLLKDDDPGIVDWMHERAFPTTSASTSAFGRRSVESHATSTEFGASWQKVSRFGIPNQRSSPKGQRQSGRNRWTSSARLLTSQF